MKVFFTSDHHFGHKNVIEYCGRPFADVQEMDRIMIERWNDTVGSNDLVCVVGDFMLGQRKRLAELVASLNGKKTLIYGNHDKRLASKKKFVEAGFTEAYNELVIQLGERDIRLNHYPYKTADFTYPEGIPDHRPDNDGKWLIHGHIHNRWKVRGNMINVGVDVWDFRPVSADTIDRTIREIEDE